MTPVPSFSRRPAFREPQRGWLLLAISAILLGCAQRAPDPLITCGLLLPEPHPLLATADAGRADGPVAAVQPLPPGRMEFRRRAWNRIAAALAMLAAEGWCQKEACGAGADHAIRLQQTLARPMTRQVARRGFRAHRQPLQGPASRLECWEDLAQIHELLAALAMMALIQDRPGEDLAVRLSGEERQKILDAGSALRFRLAHGLAGSNPEQAVPVRRGRSTGTEQLAYAALWAVDRVLASVRLWGLGAVGAAMDHLAACCEALACSVDGRACFSQAWIRIESLWVAHLAQLAAGMP